MVYIYALIMESTKDLFYVGKTTNPEKRMSSHISTTPKSYKEDCYMAILEKGDHLVKEDEAFWINYMISLGCVLKNKQLYRGTPTARQRVVF